MVSQDRLKGWVWAIPAGVGAILLATGGAAAEAVDIAVDYDRDVPVEATGSTQWGETAPIPLAQVTTVSEILDSQNLSGLTSAFPSTGPEHTPAADALGQLTNVSQLSDVTPDDWAYQAIQALVERYGVIAGYPDGTFRGDRPMTRFEFAAALNATLDQMASLIGNTVSNDDLATMQRLQEEFAVELSSLAGQIDNLEGQVAELKANQFSTTTTLRGLAVFNLSDAFASGPITAERNPFVPDIPFAPPRRDANNQPTQVQRELPNTVFNYLVWLNLNTSFTGQDQLVTQLAVGNGTAPTNQLVSSGSFNTWGAPFLETTPAPNGGADQVIIRELHYSFPLSDQVDVTIGPRINFYRHFDNNRYTFFLRGATTFNSNGSTLSNAVDRGAGAVVAWNVNPDWRVTVGYLGQNSEFLANNPVSDPSIGLFGGTNTLTGELAFSPGDNLNLRLLYTRSNLQPNNGFVTGEPVPYGIIDDGFGGPVNNASANTFIANFDWEISDNFGLFGRYSYGNTNVDPIDPSRAGGSVNTQAIQFGLAFPNLGKRGALGVLSFLVPHDYLSGRQFLLAGGGNGATQYEIEASYFYPINRNLAIIPAFYAIANPNSFSTNPTVFAANIRTQFSF